MGNEVNYELVKFVDGQFELEVTVNPKEETIWMSLDQIVKLFERDKSVISRHIKKIFQDNELVEDAVVAKNETTASDGKTYIVTYYNLDMIISIGYRVNSRRGSIFRKWANNILREYLLRCYAINENRVIVNNDNLSNLLLVVNDIQANQIDINNRLQKVEDKVLDKEHGFNQIFYNGQFYDAYTLIQNIFESANNEIIIIDNYIDRTILDRLTIKKKLVNVIIYTNINTSRLLGTDINIFNNQYGGLDVKYTTKVHDRYIVVD